MKIEVLRKSLLTTNEKAAEQNRVLFDEHGITAVHIMGGAGCGKTALLESVIPRLRPKLRIAVVEGDVATTKDAERIAALDVPVVQVLTEGGCHLTASLVRHALDRLPIYEIDLLLIENVGNPICPANFNLGEHLRIALLSVTEGDDKPAKYPFLFKSADWVIVTKTDLLPQTDFHVDRALANIHALDEVKPTMLTSTRNDLGIDAVAERLSSLVEGRSARGVLKSACTTFLERPGVFSALPIAGKDAESRRLDWTMTRREEEKTAFEGRLNTADEFCQLFFG